MISLLRPDLIKDEARDEAYEYFDKHIRKLHKRADGTVDPKAFGLENNDVDAFRHAHVSGVFTQVYNEEVADIFGRINEYSPLSWYSNAKNPGSLNMDFWNNAIGRKYGKKGKDRQELLKLIHEALKNSELIIDPSDKRKYEGNKSDSINKSKYEGNKSDSINKSKPIVVLKEDKNGRNELFFDLVKNVPLTREEFVAAVEAGNYPAYTVKIIHGIATPVSNPDGRQTNNLS